MSFLNKNKLNKSLDLIQPTKEQKERMLKNILEQVEVNKTNKENNYTKEINIMTYSKSKSKKIKQWVGVAASLMVVAGIGMIWKQSNIPTNPNEPQNAIESPANCENGPRKIMNYEGYRYAFINDGTEFEIKENSLGQKLGNVSKDATFGAGGTIYSLNEYNSEFRVAINFEGKFYIAQNVAKSDDSAIDIKDYFNKMGINDRITKVEILDHMGTKVLKTLDKDAANILINSFKQTKIAELSNENYEAIANAQSTGKSYKISFVLEDGTKVENYIIPSMGYVSIGDYTCTSETLQQQVSDIFEGLVQENLPFN